MTPWGSCALKVKAHGGRDLDEELAGAHDESRVGVADASGKHVEGAGHAGVAVGAEENFAGTDVALRGQRGVADASVAGAVLLLELATRGIEDPVAVRDRR